MDVIISDVLPLIISNMDLPTLDNFLQTEKKFYFTTSPIILSAIHLTIQQSAQADLQISFSNSRYMIKICHRGKNITCYHSPRFSETPCCDYVSESGAITIDFSSIPNGIKQIDKKYRVGGIDINIARYRISHIEGISCSLPSNQLTLFHFALPGMVPNLYIQEPITIATYRNYQSLKKILSLADILYSRLTDSGICETKVGFLGSCISEVTETDN